MENERKTLDDRAKMTELERIRHSCAHVMATAILRLWPDAQFAYGPPVENGFYYDLECSHRISPEDFEQLEAEMKKEIKANNTFEKVVVTREQALKDAQAGRLGGLTDRPTSPSKFKLDLLQQIPEGEPISYYKNGDFIDLCAGPHVMRTGNIGAFKLTSVAAAYYKGDEKGPQLQRIYGTAFKNKTQLDEYFKMLEEAKRRDHRKIGAEMGLFAIDTEYVGPGMPLWLPKGTVLVEELEKLAKETEFAAGYVRVRTPHLAKEKMYKTSGHLPYYAESMFPPMVLREMSGFDQSLLQLSAGDTQDVIEEYGRDFAAYIHSFLKRPLPVSDDEMGKVLDRFYEGIPEDKRWELLEIARAKLAAELAQTTIGEPERYYLKAMNCPHHHRIFAAEPRSYRDLPLRLAEYGCCYRYEQSGELFGLMRVRSLNMNDAHIYCTEEQFASEFKAVNDMYLKYFKTFGLEKYQMRFSTSSPEGLGKKYVNEPQLWKKTEDMVRRVLQESGINYVEVANEAAFYGPKIDVQVWSAIGREFTIATNQVDFAVPGRFGLTYRDKDNTNKTPLCIHRAPLGTHERFIGFLIEHYAGNFPLWLAPDQVRVITLNDDAALIEYGQGIVNELRANMVRVESDFSATPFKAKIADAEKTRVHTMLVIGGRDMEAGAVSVRLHHGGPQGAKPKAEVIAQILADIKERKA
ncbi:MAG: threonine--tRNA ligase [Verrucomicrobiae bacterium]|nr:threonine--tRNA ligase [Verrucomicrobiae bacterium]